MPWRSVRDKEVMLPAYEETKRLVAETVVARASTRDESAMLLN